ncbi:MAG: CcmD family protein [Deltaproteobacteria bacterium]|nr:MAG: CcmD family protein [Deltaproteobacteria bacterium]
MVAHTAPAPIYPEAGQTALGKCPSFHADRPFNQLPCFPLALLLFSLAAHPCGRDAGGSEENKALWSSIVEAWGFVFLAYGIVWSALVLYFTLLRRRCRNIEAELDRLQPSEVGKKNGPN